MKQKKPNRQKSIYYLCGRGNQPVRYLIRRIGPDGEKVFGPMVSKGNHLHLDVPRFYWRDSRDIIEVFVWGKASKSLRDRTASNEENNPNYDKEK